MKNNYLKSKLYSISKDIFAILLSLSLLIYLSIGFVVKIWHPTWVVFIIAVVLATISNFICLAIYRKSSNETIDEFDKKYEKTPYYNKTVKISTYLLILSIVVYVVASSVTGLWHPLWLIFFVFTVVEEIMAMIRKIIYKEKL